MRLSFTIFLFLTALLPAAAAEIFPAAVDLRCEYLSAPVAVESPRPLLFWRMQDSRRGARQTAYQVLVASNSEILQADKGDLWDSKRVESDRSTHVPFQGKPLSSGQTCFWKVRVWDKDGKASAWSQPGQWSMGLLNSEDWQADWIRSPDAAANGSDAAKSITVTSPWMRKTFELDAEPSRATAYINVRGYYELYVNGKKIGDDVLSPAVSDYSRRSFYVVHDIAQHLHKGRNCLALWLGQGWHAPDVRGVEKPGPLARAQFDLIVDGKPLRIATDATWKTQASCRELIGKWFWNDFGGERCDDRLFDPQWSLAAHDDGGWRQAEVVSPPATRTEWQSCPINRVGKHIAAVKCDEWGKGQFYVLDFGTNLTGWLRLRMPKLPEGQLVRIHYADLIYSSVEAEETPGGTLPPTMSDKVFDYDGGKTRAQTYSQFDEFISAGREGEEFCSKFNYHGFRYAIIEGLPSKPSPDDAEALLIESDLHPAGSFECSNDLLNRIYRLNLWTIRCLNLGGYLSDCPHRERVGYGDGQVSAEMCLMNLYMPTYYQKWLGDWFDSQDPQSGDLPHVAPHMPGGGGPGWGGIAAALAWRMYVYYGDRRLLEESFDSLKRYVDFLESRCTNNILRTYGGKWDFIGDWVPPGHGMETDNWQLGAAAELFNNCYRVYLWELLEKTAGALGRDDEVARAQAKLKEIRPLIHKEFFDPEKLTYAIEGQTYRAFPLFAGIVPKDRENDVFHALETGLIEKRKGRLDTGMLGTYFLIQYLQKVGRNDLIYSITATEDYPGWGYMLARGATTMWEQWNGHWSRIHSCFTSIGGWFNQAVAGIEPDAAAPGFKRFVIKPSLVGNLTWAKAHFDSLYGRIESSWRLEQGTLQLDVVIPANTTARVCIPAKCAAAVTESGRPVSSVQELKFLGMENGRVVFAVQAGDYHFTTETPIK